MDGGTLMNQCLHNIDLLQWMLGGEVRTVYAQTANYLRDIEGEDFGAIILRFANGAIGIVEGSACVYPTNLEETLSIFGEEGTVCLGGLAVNRVEVWKVKDEERVVKGNEPDPDTVYGDGHIPLYRDFLEAVAHGRIPYICGRAGKKAVEIILAAYKSQLTGQPVELPLGNFSTLDMVRARLKWRQCGEVLDDYVISSVHPCPQQNLPSASLWPNTTRSGFCPAGEGWRSEGIDHVALPRGRAHQTKNFFILFRLPCPEARVIIFRSELMLVGLAAKVFGKRWSTMCMKIPNHPLQQVPPNHCAVWSACCINGWKNSVVAV